MLNGVLKALVRYCGVRFYHVGFPRFKRFFMRVITLHMQMQYVAASCKIEVINLPQSASAPLIAPATMSAKFHEA